MLSPGASLTRDLDIPVNPWLVLLTLALCVSWLLPTHMIPWRSFHAEMAMVMAALPVALWAPLRSRAPCALPWIALVPLAAASIPWMQWLAGRIQYVGDAWVTSAYWLAFGLAIVTGARFQRVEPGRLAPVLFGAVTIASILSVGLVLYQLLHLTGLGLLTIEFPYSLRPRPFANLAQSNHLATLLVWGLIALWWMHLRGDIGGRVGLVAAAFLLFGIAATQSRTAWIELGVLLGAAVAWRRILGAGRNWPGVLGLLVFFIVLVAAWARLTETVEFTGVRQLNAEMSSAGLRPSAWRLFLEAAAERPWAGWGWNQISLAQLHLALEHPSLGYNFHSAHNLVLDLVLQQGIPLSALIVGAFLTWYVVTLRRVATAEGALLVTAVTVLLVHAMLEFPQNYTYFLVPAGLMIGLLHAGDTAARSIAVSRWPVFGLACLAVAVAGWMTVEYRMVEKSLEQVRMERNRVGFARGSVAPDLKMLTQLEEFLTFLRLRYAEPAPPGQLERMRRLVAHYPSDGNFLVLAVAEATNGHPDRAADSLARMCRVVPAQRCKDVLATWRTMAAQSPTLGSVVLPR